MPNEKHTHTRFGFEGQACMVCSTTYQPHQSHIGSYVHFKRYKPLTQQILRCCYYCSRPGWITAALRGKKEKNYEVYFDQSLTIGSLLLRCKLHRRSRHRRLSWQQRCPETGYRSSDSGSRSWRSPPPFSARQETQRLTHS